MGNASDFIIENGVLVAYNGSDSHMAIPEGVTAIAPKLLEGKSHVTSVTIPSSVTEIRGVAFYDCPALMSITVPAGVTEVGFGAFLDCPSLTDIYVDQSERLLLVNVSVPEGCTIHWNSTVLDR